MDTKLAQQQLLETMAVQFAAERALPGTRHGSKLARIPVGCWQAATLAAMPDIAKAASLRELQEAMSLAEFPVILLPAPFQASEQEIDGVLAQSGLSKMVIWEKD